MEKSESGICTHIFLASVQVEYKMTMKINICIAQYFSVHVVGCHGSESHFFKNAFVMVAN